MANAQKRLSPAGARFIAGWEGLVLHPYNDPWNATIGIGHLIHLGRVTAADVAHYRGFTAADAYALLKRDVADVEAQIRSRISIDLDQNEWDALVSLVFNTGPDVLEGDVGHDINDRQLRAAADAWQAWCHGDGGVVLQGLVRRRAAERELFLRAEPPYVPADEQRWEREYDAIARKRGSWAALRRRVLRRTMTARRKQIWHLAQKHGGWEERNRAARYRSLLVRTE